MSTVKFFRNNAVTILLGIWFTFIAWNKAPIIWRMYQNQGAKALGVSVRSLTGEVINIPMPGKQVLIFWATWCAPCKIELARINKMIASGDLPATSVLAVSIGEDPSSVADFVRQNNYYFSVAVDLSGQAASIYKVSGTPTLLLIDEQQNVYWMTMGLSPSLELRITSFFNSTN